MENIDFELLRRDLLDYFGTAMVSGFSAVVMDLNRVETATNEELLFIAIECKFDLEDYVIFDNEMKR